MHALRSDVLMDNLTQPVRPVARPDPFRSDLDALPLEEVTRHPRHNHGADLR